MKDGSYIGFEWDDSKALSNVAKHGISFDEATTAFSDPYGRIIEDQTIPSTKTDSSSWA